MSGIAAPSDVAVVLDTNVVVSAVLAVSDGAPSVRALRAVREGRIQLVLSEPLLDEYRDALHRPRLVRRHGLSPIELETLLWALRETSLWVEAQVVAEAPPDPDDRHVWATCLAVPEVLLVKGDDELRAFAQARGSALSPRQFVDSYLET